MLEILKSLTDDQTALLGCGVALIAATLSLMMSFHANPNNRQNRSRFNSEVDVEASGDMASEKSGENSRRQAA